MKIKDFNWSTGSFVIGYHLLLVVVLPIYLSTKTPSLAIILTTVIVGSLCGLTITAGYHRLYTHRAYEINEVGEWIILGMGALALENSVLQWANDHRNHHQYVDTEKDPYSIKKGFWYAHIVWLFKKGDGIDKAMVPDLISDKAVMFQHKYYAIITAIANIGVILMTGWLFKDFLGAVALVFLSRVFVVHHLTWFINSLAHTVGSKPYSKEHSAVNNAAIAFLTFGEGYHNYHHTFPSDYRNGVRWYQFDPTKIVIWCLAKIGMAKNLKKVELPLIKRKMILEDQRVALEKIKMLGRGKWSMIEGQVKRAAESLSAKLLEKYSLVREYRAKKKEERKEMKLKLKALKRSIREEYKIWIKLCGRVLTRKLRVSA